MTVNKTSANQSVDEVVVDSGEDNGQATSSGANKPTTLLPPELRGIPERSREQYKRNQQALLEARNIRELRRGSSQTNRYGEPTELLVQTNISGGDYADKGFHNDNNGHTSSRSSNFKRRSDDQAGGSNGYAGENTSLKVNDSGFDGVVDSRVIPDAGLPTELVNGVLELQPNYQGYLRVNYLASSRDVYVSSSQVRRFGLKHGDMVSGQARQPKENERYWGLLKVESVNEVPVEEQNAVRLDFDGLESEYPDEQIVLTTEAEPMSTRLIDLISPIGKGQRGLIVSPPKAGKTWLLKDIAAGVAANYPDLPNTSKKGMHLMALLIGERPEEVTDMNKNIKGEVVASNFDHPPHVQVAVAELGLERAKRLVEMGKDVFILLDSITRLARAYNLMGKGSGRTMSGGFDAGAIFPAKKFLGAARKMIGGGSLTIIGTALVDTGSRMDELIYEEFKGTGNMELHLSRKLAERRVFPSIDVQRSGTRQEELLYDKELYPQIVRMRRMLGLLDDDERTELLLEKLRKTKTNKQFLEEIAKAG